METAASARASSVSRINSLQDGKKKVIIMYNEAQNDRWDEYECSVSTEACHC